MLRYNRAVSDSAPVTRLLEEWRAGDPTALDRLIPLVYNEMRRMAGAYLQRESEPHTLQPTALVHEDYLRLAAGQDPDFQNRAHFFSAAARVMRQILVDHARARCAAKRGGREPRVPFEESALFAAERAATVVALDDALLLLERQDAVKARILELKYFAGMTAEDSAAVLGLTVHQVNRQVRLAQAWLRREMVAAEN